MTTKLENEKGIIAINNEVIARIAGLATIECYGIVGMAARNVKDGLVQLLKLESLTKGIRIYTDTVENQVKVELHIIVEYGTNISVIAENVKSTVCYSVKEYTGIDVTDVKICVDGVRID